MNFTLRYDFKLNKHNPLKFFLLLFALVLLLPLSLPAQPVQTADEFVLEYKSGFGYGTNVGVFPPWRDEQIAELAAGNSASGIAGIGANTYRVWLPEWFVEYWGYGIRHDAFIRYSQIGLQNLVVFIGDPSPEHMDSTLYCPGRFSASFKNLYTPIWDDGANGTPVNDTNFFALYVYRLALNYGSEVRFWELLNEPDTDLSGHAILEPGMPGNWWENNPGPCETKFGAPIFYYVRMLRIAYEVIKSVHPEDYIAVGGLGNAAFLDAILRNTDDPDSGKTSIAYPRRGGAYFDALSFHSYPHFDGSLRFWSNAKGGFAYRRHSDAAVDGYILRKQNFDTVLARYGYEGTTLPRKIAICTETNITRKTFQPDHLGSSQAQRNYLIKTLVMSQVEGISQVHVYTLGDDKPELDATFDYDLMGMYRNFANQPLDQAQITDAGIAYRTCTQLLRDWTFDPAELLKLKLPAGIRGGAFRNATSHVQYVLWAVTSTDGSEAAAMQYTFPAELGIERLQRRKWNFSLTGKVDFLSPQDIALTGDPFFITPEYGHGSPRDTSTGSTGLRVFPNPLSEEIQVELSLPYETEAELSIWSAGGQLITTLLPLTVLGAGIRYYHLPSAHLPQGVYFVRLRTPGNIICRKAIKF
jgi:hypothetical protein